MAFVLLAACGVQRTPTSYTSSVGKNFVKACGSQGRTDGITNADDVCTCAYNKIKATVKFSEFKKINSDLSAKPGPLPEPLLGIVQDCTRSAESSGVKTPTSSSTSGSSKSTTTTR